MTWWITDTSIGQRLKFVRRFRRLTQKELGLHLLFFHRRSVLLVKICYEERVNGNGSMGCIVDDFVYH